MRYLDESDFHPDAYAFAGEDSRAEGLDAADLTDALRSALSEDYAEASDEEIGDALANVLDSMSAAEAFNFASALNRIGKGASQLVSDPAFAAVAQTALPIIGSAAGTMIGGPAGAAVGGKLGSLAASALPTRPAAAPAPPSPVPAPVTPAPPAPAPVAAAAPAPVAAAAPAPAAAGTPVPSAPVVTAPGAPATPAGPASPAAGGSAAAAQGLVLTQQPDVLRSLLATALGEHGRQTVSGVPVPQVLGMLSQVFGEAAADADELMYLGQRPDAAESALEEGPADAIDSLYADLLGADNLELADATEWDWPGR
jgi:hypothetical protein